MDTYNYANVNNPNAMKTIHGELSIQIVENIHVSISELLKGTSVFS